MTDKLCMKHLFLLLLFVSACAQNPVDESDRDPASTVVLNRTWKGYVESVKGPLQNLFPDSKYIQLPWRKYSEFDVDGSQFPPTRVNAVPLKCQDKKLYPTHPQQFTKEYLMGLVASYARQEMPGTASSCITPNPTKKYCLNSQSAVVAVMSDIYADACGNFYRGYWVVSYRVGGGLYKSEDSMGTLFAKGRTQYEKPNSLFPGREFVDGNTYPVDSKDFLLLGTILPNDIRRMKESQALAVKAGFRKKGLIWIPKGQ